MQEDTNTLNYLNETERGYFKELQAQIGDAGSDEGGVSAAAAMSLDELCKKYNQIKGTLELVLKAVEKIPGIGKKIAKAIRFLMMVADFACAGGDETDFAVAAADSSGVSLSLEQIEAFNRLDAALDSTAGFSFASSSEMAAAAGFNKEEICSKYRKVRKFLKLVLPIIGLIPGVGGTIVSVITILMGIADSICGEG